MRPLFVLREGLRLALASCSPRRRAFLEDWGVPFEIRPVAGEPDPREGEDALSFVERSARFKLAHAERREGEIALAADTVVALEGRVLGKPADEAEALDMLKALSGRWHEVATAVALGLPDGSGKVWVDRCRVRFGAWSEEVLRAYAATGEGLDKAGAYAVQGRGAFLVERVEGSWTTVVGLPVSGLAEELLERGLLLPAEGKGYAGLSKAGDPQPKTGKTIGHSINGAYVPSPPHENNRLSEPYLEYAPAKFVNDRIKDIYSDLLHSFDVSEVFSIMSVALCFLTQKPQSYKSVKTLHDESFTSVYYKGAAVSASTLRTRLGELGNNDLGRRAFFLRRKERLLQGALHAAMDGAVTNDASSTNGESDGRVRFVIRISKSMPIIYACDIESGELLCADVIPSYRIPLSAYAPFVEKNRITEGVLVADKGFPVRTIENLLFNYRKLHFLYPLRRTLRILKRYDMFTYDGVLPGFPSPMMYKKRRTSSGRFLYSFRDSDRAAKEDREYVMRMGSEPKAFDPEKYYDMRQTFGCVAFLSDLDVAPEIIYSAYGERGEIEDAFKEFKTELDCDSAREQSFIAVEGDAFIKTICAISKIKIINYLRKCHVLPKMNYDFFFNRLRKVSRKANAPEPAARNDGFWLNPEYIDYPLLEKIGQLPPPPREAARKRGRPPKPKPEVEAPKRPRGRPRKNQEKGTASQKRSDLHDRADKES